MGRKDVRVGEVDNYTKTARKKVTEAARTLSSPPRSADRGRKDAVKAASLLNEAIRYADSAVSSAESLTKAAQDSASRRLLEEAKAYRESLESGKLILEVVQNPGDRAKHKKLGELLKDGGKKVAADQIGSSGMAYVLQAATAHTVDGLISILTNLPPGSGKAAEWTGGAVAEAVGAIRQKYRNASSGVDPVTGNCAPSRPCHNCRRNAENPGTYRACLHPNG